MRKLPLNAATFSVLVAIVFAFNFPLLHAQVIDLSKPVGSPKGSGGPNGSGGVTYTIPIEVPAGVNGMQPNVSLVYNSQAGISNFGWGWNLSALSMITRTGRSNYYNDVNSPVSYTNSLDAFVLDGQRLFVTSGTNGANGAVYGTENEQFNKIESFGGNETTGPAWFRVTLKNGTKMEYGNATNSKLLTDNGSSTMVWMLNRITDINGNYQDFKYAVNNTDRNFVLTEIAYTGNTAKGVTPQDKIQFAYTVNPTWQNQVSYVSGASIITPFLLSTIKVIHSDDIGTTIKTYTCSYTTLNKQYFLESFTETAYNGWSLNPLTFSYGSNLSAADVNISPSYNNLFPYNNVYSGELTGDGKQDLVAVYSSIDNNNNRHDSVYYVLDNFNDFETPGVSIAYSYAVPYNYLDRASQIQRPSNSFSFLTTDYDGDSKQDVLMMNWTIWKGVDMLFNGVTINYSRTYNITAGHTYKSINYPDIPHVSAYDQDFAYSYKNGTNFIPGDFDGDGAQDYILILGINSTNAFKAFFSSPKKGIFNKEIMGFGVEGLSSDPFYATSVANSKDVMPIEFDGDGKTEILVQKENQSYVLSVFPVSPATGFNYAATTLCTTTAIKAGYRVFPGDFNGDGNSDLLIRASQHSASATWSLLYSTGKTFSSFPFIFNKVPRLDGDGVFLADAHLLQVADLNGDGKSDIWHSADETSGGLKSVHTIYYSNGIPASWQNSTAVFTAVTYTKAEGINRSTVAQTIQGDFNGDGKSDMLSLTGTSGRFIYPKPFKEDRLMAKSTDGFGNQTSYNYGLWTDNNLAVYQRSVIYEYDNPNTPPGQQINGNPYAVIKAPIYALSTITFPDGIGGTAVTAYSYKDAAVSSIRGFLGFKEITETNYNTGSLQTTYSEIDANLLVSHVNGKTISVGGTVVSDVTITDALTRVNPGNYLDKRYTYRISQTTDKNALTSAVTQSTNTYDNYNNVTKNVTSKGYINSSGLFSATETATATTVFGIHGTPVPAAPESVTSSKVTFNVTDTKKTTYTYDTKGNVITSTEFAGTPLATNTTNTYDGFGNITKVVISAPNTLTPVIIFTYDGSGRYLLQKETVGSDITKTEKFTYDLYFGLVATATSSDGLVTSYTYDAFGRRTKTTLPDGNAITEAIGWETAGGARYSTVSQRMADGGLYNKEYFDVLGRKIKTETGGFNGQILTSTTAYNYKGQMVSQTEPKYPKELLTTTTYTYDSYGRLTASSNGTSSATVSFAILPGGLYKVTTTNGAGQASSKTMNAAGRVFYTNDNGGQLNFAYAGWGYQTSVKIGGTTLVSSVYDAYGRQTSLTDKNAGTITYEYDALGKITKQTDAKGNVSTLVYDAFGRVTSRTGAEGTTTYEYYEDVGTGKCNDNIWKITGFAGDITEYEYDNLGRPTKESIVVDGLTFTKTMVYDSYGNLIKTTYPSGVIINDTYDKNGILTKTTMGSGTVIPLFTATAMNSKGVYTGYSYGNGKASTVTYDLVKGAPTRYFTAGVQDLNLNFDGQTGNLLSRNDAIKTHTETFSYDNLNRLTSAKVDGVTQFSMTYDALSGASLGNIKSKSDVGNYTYKTDKINAVAYITSTAGGTTPPGVISQNQQDITYTAFLKAATVAENGYLLSYTYGQDQQRIKGVLNQGANEIERRYYLRAFERQKKGATTRDIHYINAGNGLCAIIVKEGATTTPYFVYSDHLGSILTITNASGTIVAEQNFDAWGRNRNPANWTYAGVPTVPDWLYRGFTGHEHLPQFALINMNGRMYDPATGRMISPDNYVPMPWNTQGYNRYSYANNNPLIYTDPDGEFWFLIPLVIGGVINVATHWDQIHNFKDGLVAFGIGAAAGTAAYFTGGAALGAIGGLGVTGGFLGGAAAGIGAAAAASPIQGIGNMAYFGDPYSVKQFGLDVLSGGITGGVIGGTTSLVKGRNFWNNNTIARNPATGETASQISFRNEKLKLEWGWKKNSNGKWSYVEAGIPYDGEFPENVLPLPKQTTSFSGTPSITNSSFSNSLESPNTLYTRFVATKNGIVDLGPTIDRIAANQSFPHIRDGSIFFNKEGLLPAQPMGYYREFVAPTYGVKGPGAMRIVSGGAGEAWFTPDHYKTFIPIR